MNKIRVLLIEDNLEDAELIRSVLVNEVQNITVKHLDSFELFKEVIRASNYDLIITDYHCGDFTGFDIVNEVRERDLDIPIILITADKNKEMALNAIKMQVDDFVIKEFKFIKQLPSIIYRVLEKSFLEKHKRTCELPILDNTHDYVDLFENTSEIIQSLWATGAFINVNKAWFKHLEYTRDELHDLNFSDLVADEWKVEYQDIISNTEQNREPQAVELELIKKSGDKLHIQGTVTPRIENNKTIGSTWMLHDVTNQKKVENMVDDMNMQYMSAFDYAPNPLIMGDHRGIVLQINRAACDLVGYSYEEIKGKHIRSLTHPMDLLKSLKYHKKLLNGELDNYTIEKRYRHKEGHYVKVQVDAALIRNDKGQPRFAIAELNRMDSL